MDEILDEGALGLRLHARRGQVYGEFRIARLPAGRLFVEITFQGVAIDGFDAIAGHPFRENQVDETPTPSGVGALSPEHEVVAHRVPPEEYHDGRRLFAQRRMSIAYTWERLVASDRRNAEDRAEVFVSGEDLVIVVADGAGGVPGGGSASDALVAAVSDEIQRAGDSCDLRRWAKVFHETDADLARHLSGETTGILVVLGPRGLVGLSAGDCEAWVVGATSIDDLTVHQRRGRVGSGRVAAAAFDRQALDGVLVVGTDGLFRYAAPEGVAAIVRTVNPLAEAARRLSEVVRLSSGRLQDDFAVVVARRAGLA